jgi:hypothetical protein
MRAAAAVIAFVQLVVMRGHEDDRHTNEGVQVC